MTIVSSSAEVVEFAPQFWKPLKGIIVGDEEATNNFILDLIVIMFSPFLKDKPPFAEVEKLSRSAPGLIPLAYDIGVRPKNIGASSVVKVVVAVNAESDDVRKATTTVVPEGGCFASPVETENEAGVLLGRKHVPPVTSLILIVSTFPDERLVVNDATLLQSIKPDKKFTMCEEYKDSG
jgi:hypothetical protein